MKKLKVITLAGAVVLTMSACSSNQGQSNAGSVAQAESQSGSSSQTVQEIPVTADSAQMGENNILITYFTVPETDEVDTVARASRVVVDGEVLGNCQYVAQLIQETVGGELFEIETVQDYLGSHDPLLDFAYAEKTRNARPELASRIENLEDYDYIFIGFSRTVQTIAEMLADAIVMTNVLSISRESVQEAQSQVASWAESLELK